VTNPKAAAGRANKRNDPPDAARANHRDA